MIYHFSNSFTIYFKMSVTTSNRVVNYSGCFFLQAFIDGFLQSRLKAPEDHISRPFQLAAQSLLSSNKNCPEKKSIQKLVIDFCNNKLGKPSLPNPYNLDRFVPDTHFLCVRTFWGEALHKRGLHFVKKASSSCICCKHVFSSISSRLHDANLTNDQSKTDHHIKDFTFFLALLLS